MARRFVLSSSAQMAADVARWSVQIAAGCAQAMGAKTHNAASARGIRGPSVNSTEVVAVCGERPEEISSMKFLGALRHEGPVFRSTAGIMWIR